MAAETTRVSQPARRGFHLLAPGIGHSRCLPQRSGLFSDQTYRLSTISRIGQSARRILQSSAILSRSPSPTPRFQASARKAYWSVVADSSDLLSSFAVDAFGAIRVIRGQAFAH